MISGAKFACVVCSRQCLLVSLSVGLTAPLEQLHRETERVWHIHNREQFLKLFAEAIR